MVNGTLLRKEVETCDRVRADQSIDALQPLWTVARPGERVLCSGEIHVWSALLDQSDEIVSHMEGILAAHERERAARFHFPRDRARFTMGRSILRMLLGGYLEIPPTNVRYVPGTFGKLELTPQNESNPLRFNLSHRHGLALYAFVLDQEVGVDVEWPRNHPDLERVSERFFSESEKEALRAVPPDQRQVAFFNCWTRKEAFIKAIGTGLSYPLHEFDVSLAPGEPARLCGIRGNASIAEGWHLQELLPCAGFVGALAAPGRDWRVICSHCCIPRDK
jgi:4'-phosphopantetheinyl transferase